MTSQTQQTPASHLFEATGVTCQIPSENGSRTIFEDLNFYVDRGEIVDLTGPSGSGKSTLLTAFARLNVRTSGTFTVNGVDSSTMTPQQWREQVSYLPQTSTLMGSSVAEAIRLPFTFKVRMGESEQSAEEVLPDTKIRAMLDSIGCSDINLDRKPRELSGGQAARVSLARTLLTEPKVLLADEVDAGLDPENADLVGQIMQEAAERGMGIIRIRHRATDHRATRMYELAHGQLKVISAEDAEQGGEA
ncbi:ABC transporter ATP-binding protein [Bifidobacterium dolichotidis]|uniref:ABC transporter ATP-binding protein n=1 Tax=Bifidobacterium dolichotidis TaxID=2306976 RepID=A0A430FQ34_9BIFI|nr:ATP-binding cassette domain-containing protein [Bifidobacterium dolichotidis]RSX54925.1 ABC transporter ATP-binding protein [Bifidobacterium dolichotidis]